MDSAFDYAKVTPIDTEVEYPYTAKNGDCSIADPAGVKAISYHDVTPNSP